MGTTVALEIRKTDSQKRVGEWEENKGQEGRRGWKNKSGERRRGFRVGREREGQERRTGTEMRERQGREYEGVEIKRGGEIMKGDRKEEGGEKTRGWTENKRVIRALGEKGRMERKEEVENRM